MVFITESPNTCGILLGWQHGRWPGGKRGSQASALLLEYNKCKNVKMKIHQILINIKQ
jgi:hypothetical protein